MKPVFLDRDGVVSLFTPDDYIKNWGEFSFIPGAIEGLARLRRAGFTIFFISNQGGVNKGLFSMADLDDITGRMRAALLEQGVEFEKAYYCPHTSGEHCACRKPNPGLFFEAGREFGPIDFSTTFLIGDSDIDMEAGNAAGCRTILVLTGRTKSADETSSWNVKPDYIAQDLISAASIILGTPY
jgi:D-glycero-D-manno-heptose 1,7-bisphosphate phosphatase